MKLIEKILIKLLGNTKDFDFNMCDWDIMSLGEHYWYGNPLTPSEKYASDFLEQVGEVLNVWQPIKKFKRAYGDELNEHRNLH